MSKLNTSEELFHLVGRQQPQAHEVNYQILLKILKEGCVSPPSHSQDWSQTQVSTNLEGSLLTEDLIVPSATCFCHISWEHLRLRFKKYGLFGLSFDRQYLIHYGARPVSYFPLHQNDWSSPFGKTLLQDIEQVYRSFQKQVLDHESSSRSLTEPLESPESATEAVDNVLTKDFLAFIKPFNSELPDEHPDNYYLDREWRKLGYLKFEPKQVRRILVEKNFVERLKQDLPDYADKVEVAEC